MSDTLFEGRRMPVIAASCLALCPVLLLLFFTTAPAAPAAAAVAADVVSTAASSTAAFKAATVSPSVALRAVCFALGAAAFSPHVLIGLCAREVSHRRTVSTAGGFVKFIGQLGGVYPVVSCTT
jgi:sugar phosphate permease